MKAVLTVSRRGAVTVPPALRRALGIVSGDRLTAEMVPDGLLLRRAVRRPVELYSAARLREFAAGEADLAPVIGTPIRRLRGR